MDLQEFIKQTLVQIVKGTAEAQTEIAQIGGVVNPLGLSFAPSQMQGRRYTGDHNITQDVTFDVAITASEGSGTKGGIGVVVGAVALGSQGRSDKAVEAVNRIQFTVPVLLPGHRASG